ncbi:efflux RND transporter periplasmic adaptor subunit [Verrucomicrobiota bacterium sgz303538]
MSEQAAEFEQRDSRAATPQRSPARQKSPKQSSQPSDQSPKTAESGEKPKAPWYRRPWIVVILAILFVAAVIFGTLYLLKAISTESTDNAFIDAHVVQVAPRVGGRVATVSAEDNQHVEPGDVLLELDPRDFETTLQQRRAAVQNTVAKRNVAQTTYEEAEAHTTTLEANVASAKAEAESAQASLKRAEDDLRRTRQLTASGSASQQELQHAITAAEASKANLEAAQKKAAAAIAQRTENQASIASAKAQIEAASAEVEQAKAAEAAAQLDLSYTKLIAPEAGRVTNRTVAPGNYVQVGQAVLAIVPTNLWVTANFKETQLDQMRPGQLVTIKIDAYPGHHFKGHVDSIQRGSGAQFSLLPPENATGNYVKVVQRVPVKIMFDEPLPAGTALGPGMSIVPTVVVSRIVYRTEILAGTAILSVIVAVTGALILLRRKNKVAEEPTAAPEDEQRDAVAAQP